MAKFLSAKDVREVNDVQFATVAVPEWGGEGTEIRLRSLSAGDMVKFTSLKGENAKQGIVRGLILSAVDEDGERIFTNDDIQWLMSKNVAVLHRIQDAILVLNGMRAAASEDDETDLEKAGKG